jgi:hypothetical protein
MGINITSFMGGRANPWVSSAGSVGIKNPYKKNAPRDYNKGKKMERELGFHDQDSSDGKIEFLSFTNAISYAIFKKGHRLL